MPNEKLLEVLNFSQIPPKTEYLSIIDMHRHFNKVLDQAFQILDAGKVLSYEHTEGESVDIDPSNHRIQKKGRDSFAYSNSWDGFKETKEIRAIDVLNMLYAHVPFVPMFGYENYLTLEIDKQ